MSIPFADRADAGRQLAPLLEAYRGPKTVVLGLPRGGVPVAAEVAAHLGAPLDVIVVRKLGTPHHAELAMGAIGENGVLITNEGVIGSAKVSDRALNDEVERQSAELESRVRRFRGKAERIDLSGKTALLVDDGLATGATARAACLAARGLGAARVILAVPVAPTDAIIPESDDLVVLHKEPNFWAVGQFYSDFAQVPDDEVTKLLAERSP